MANLLINKHRNVLTSSLIKHMSSHNNNRTKFGIISIVPNDDNIWSESYWSEFGKQFNKFKQFPLPGQTGITYQKNKPLFKSEEKSFDLQNLNILNENLYYLLQEPLSKEKQAIKLKEASNCLSYIEKMERYQSADKKNLKATFELKAYACPKSLINDFQSYFRLNSIGDTQMTLITISFKTENDMATWNNQVDAEREFITDKFLDKAQELCQFFEQQGYWADYVDPSSGTLHKSPYNHATFYETDERYRHLGFEIIDNGCCKVISHHEWGEKFILW